LGCIASDGVSCYYDAGLFFNKQGPFKDFSDTTLTGAECVYRTESTQLCSPCGGADAFPAEVTYELCCGKLCRTSTPEIILAMRSRLIEAWDAFAKRVSYEKKVANLATGSAFMCATSKAADGSVIVQTFVIMTAAAGRHGRFAPCQMFFPLDVLASEEH